MQSPKLATATFASGAQETFDTLLAVIQKGSFEQTGLDPDRHVVTFTSGKTMISWGHEYIATIEPSETGSRLELMCGGVDNRPKALLDGRKNAKAGAKVIATLRAALGGSAAGA
jgi:hypothetical protein